MTEKEEKDRHNVHHNHGVHKHFCLEWDGMYICDECPEFDACLCFKTSKPA